MSSSSQSFASLAEYLAKGKSGDEPERVAWSESRNLPTNDPELAGTIMRATAAQNDRVRDPVYHLVLSFDPADQVDRATMERVADHVIAALKLQEHQILIVAHGDRAHQHMHLLVNRVHPETGRVWNRWQDRTILQQVLREEEKALGLRLVPGRLASRDQLSLEIPQSEAARKDAADIGMPPSRSDRTAAIAAGTQSRQKELAALMRSHERVVELGREQYTTAVDVAAAQARSSNVRESLHRLESAHSEFNRALGAVYRDPDAARIRFDEVAMREGQTAATQALRERPESLGPLIAVETPRVFGLVRASSDALARAAAIQAAIKSAALFDAERSAAQHFPREEHREREGTPGPAIARPGNTIEGPPPKLLRIDIQSALAAVRADVERAGTREVVVTRELRTLPDRANLERHIIGLLDRMTPRELRQLRHALTPPQLTLALKLKAAIRETVLGEDRAHQR